MSCLLCFLYGVLSSRAPIISEKRRNASFDGALNASGSVHSSLVTSFSRFFEKLAVHVLGKPKPKAKAFHSYLASESASFTVSTEQALVSTQSSELHL